MALDEADKKAIAEMINAGLKEAGPAMLKEVGSSVEQRLQALKSELAPKEKAHDTAKAGEKSVRDPETDRQLADLQRQVREAALVRHLPKNLNPERVGLLTKVLEAEGRLITRGDQHFIRLDRNGIPTEVPLAQGLAEYAGSKEADAFVLAPAAGSGGIGGTIGGNPGAVGKVTPGQVLAKALADHIQDG